MDARVRLLKAAHAVSQPGICGRCGLGGSGVIMPTRQCVRCLQQYGGLLEAVVTAVGGTPLVNLSRHAVYGCNQGPKAGRWMPRAKRPDLVRAHERYKQEAEFNVEVSKRRRDDRYRNSGKARLPGG